MELITIDEFWMLDRKGITKSNKCKEKKNFGHFHIWIVFTYLLPLKEKFCMRPFLYIVKVLIGSQMFHNIMNFLLYYVHFYLISFFHGEH